MQSLLATHPDIVVSGTVENQGRFSAFFHHIILLSVPIDVLLERVRNRIGNPYGKNPEQQHLTRRHTREVESLLRRGTTLELNGCRTVMDLANAVEHPFE